MSEPSLPDVELAAMATEVRVEWAERFPPGPRLGEMEAEGDRQERLELVQTVLYDEALPDLDQRLRRRQVWLSRADQDAIVEQVVARLFGITDLTRHTQDPDVEDVIAIGDRPVGVYYADGSVRRFAPLASRPVDLHPVIAEFAREAGRPFTEAHPFLDLRLPDGSRFHAEGFDVKSLPLIAIRVHRLKYVRLDHLVGFGSLSEDLASFLKASVAGGLNMLIVGEMGAGKTALSRALAYELPSSTRLAVLETDYELAVDRHPMLPDAHTYIARPGDPAHTVAKMIAPSLRSGADRLIVGEIREDGEAAPALNAMAASSGSWATVHGRWAEDGLARTAELMMGGHLSYDSALVKVYKSIDIAVLCRRSRAGRFVAEVVAPSVVGSGQLTQLVLQRLFVPGRDGRAVAADMPESWLKDLLAWSVPEFDPLEVWRPSGETVLLPLIRPSMEQLRQLAEAAP